MNRIEKITDLQRNGELNCSQALLTVFEEQFDMDAETAKRLGRPWGGGMGHLAEAVCGPAAYVTRRGRTRIRRLLNDEAVK